MMVMPNRGRVVAVLSALALAGGLLALVLLEKPAQAQAQTEHFDEWLTESTVFEADCLSEHVAVEYRAHITGTTTYDADGGYHTHLLLNTVGEGVGLTSGDEYVIHARQSGQSNVRDFEGDQLPQNATFVDDLYMIRKGSETTEDDFVLHVVYSAMIDANGEFTTHADEARIECY